MDIVNVYRERMPECRFIGKRYTEADRTGGTFAQKWGEWFRQGWFDMLGQRVSAQWSAAFPEANSSFGMFRLGAQGEEEYWIGLCLPPGTAVPGGFDHIDLPAADLGVCWIQGKPPSIYSGEDEALGRMRAEGFTPMEGPEAAFKFLKRYVSGRYTQPDAQGNLILDLLAPIRPETPGGAAAAIGRRDGNAQP